MRPYRAATNHSSGPTTEAVPTRLPAEALHRWMDMAYRMDRTAPGKLAPTDARVVIALTPVLCRACWSLGICCSLAQGTEQIGVEVGHGRNFVIEDRHAVRDGAICLAKCTMA